MQRNQVSRCGINNGAEGHHQFVSRRQFLTGTVCPIIRVDTVDTLDTLDTRHRIVMTTESLDLSHSERSFLTESVKRVIRILLRENFGILAWKNT